MIRDLVESIGPWAWVVGGLVMLGLEILLPGTFFLWFGVSAIITGATAILLDITWQVQLVIFLALAVVLLIFGRRFFARRKPIEDSGLNERARVLIGSAYILTEPIVNGSGRVRVGDTTWRVSGPDAPSGTRVRVVSVDGTLLKVEPEATAWKGGPKTIR